VTAPSELVTKPETAGRPWTTAAPAAGTRYTGTAQALHWLVAALMFTVLPLAWVMVSMGDAAPGKGLLYTLHKSVGLTILALAAVRLAWRAAHPAPALRHVARWEAAGAFASHWLLYAVLVAMPVSGYLLSAAGGHPVSYFGLFTVPGLPKDEPVAHAALAVHLATQWAVYGLVALHLAATAWHVVVRHDGALGRMLPAQDEQA